LTALALFVRTDAVQPAARRYDLESFVDSNPNLTNAQSEWRARASSPLAADRGHSALSRLPGQIQFVVVGVRAPRRGNWSLDGYDGRMKSLTTTCFSCLLFLAIVCGTSSSEAQPPFDLSVIDEQTVVISWSNAPPGYILQGSDAPGTGARWKGVLLAPFVSGNTHSVTTTVSGDWTRWFFRLRPKGAFAGLDYLNAVQGSDGTWGSASITRTRDTAAALQALAQYGQTGPYVTQGASALNGLTAVNNDFEARRAVALIGAGSDASSIVTALLNSQNPALADGSVAFPGAGWGLAGGFGNSTIDTALVLRALKSAGTLAGLAVFKETVPASGSSSPHPFTVASGGSGLFLKVRSVTGATLRFKMAPPSGGGGFYSADVSPRTTTLTIGPFPFEAGGWILTVQNLGGSAATYTAEVGFTSATGFDVFRNTTPLTYLGLAQNPDGGWGIDIGSDSQLMVTAEVLRALDNVGASFVGPQVLTAAVAWLRSHQNGDGGFGSEGSSNPLETALASIAIHEVDPTADLVSAAAYLKGTQLPNGSWGDNVFQTALVVQALRLPPVVSAIPAQAVTSPAAFTSVTLDNYVTDPDHPDSQISWEITGNTQLGVSIVNRVATITYPAGQNISEQLTFTATDPDGFSAATSATFSVNASAPPDYTIARGAFVTGSRIFTGASSVLDQTAFYTEDQFNVPTGVTYTTTGLGRISATQMQVNFRIDVIGSAALGIHEFQIDYGLLDSSFNVLGPLTGDVFNFRIQVTP
jgi:hypothetical protein